MKLFGKMVQKQEIHNGRKLMASSSCNRKLRDHISEVLGYMEREQEGCTERGQEWTGC